MEPISVAPQTVAKVLTEWINGRPLDPRATELGVQWNTLKSWSEGKTLPKDRDLPRIAQVTGYALDDLILLRSREHQLRLRRCAHRADTPEQAAAWAAARTPAAPGEDGAAGAVGEHAADVTPASCA